jgi:hypothetical protein
VPVEDVNAILADFDAYANETDELAKADEQFSDYLIAEDIDIDAILKTEVAG